MIFYLFAQYVKKIILDNVIALLFSCIQQLKRTADERKSFDSYEINNQESFFLNVHI